MKRDKKGKAFLLAMHGKAMVIAVLAFGLVLAGCATSGGSGTPPAPDKLAAQLAADLNAIKAGSAMAEGATVRLSGEVYLKTGLTVPAGVTLDLTADGLKFELQNGAELTVDGTVNASGHGNHGSGWVPGGLRIGEGTTVINGSGTINLKSKGCVLNVSGDKRHLTLGGVTLVGIEGNDNSLVEVSGGGEFVMKSGVITGNTYIASQEWGGGGVRVADGTFTMEGGEISGNSTTGERPEGIGVRVKNGGAFTMKGGKISGNSANGSVGASGGGVIIEKGSVFTMESGEISGNSATGKEWCNGGGVMVRGEFIMSGGIISGNNSISGGQAQGGGVKIGGGVFTMQGGTISGNSVSSSSGNSSGGGVFMDGGRDGVGAFTMLGGTIYGSASAANAGGNANEVRDGSGAPVTGRGAAIRVYNVPVVKWGTAGGIYTKGGVAQTGGSDIGASSDDTLIAVPAP